MLRSFVFVLALFGSATPAFAQEVRDCSGVSETGARSLCFETELPAPVADVWALWGESGQLSTWMAPVAAIDLQPGGMMEASYNPHGRIGDAGNILNRVVAVAPMQSLTIQVDRAPPGFPHPVEVRELTTLIALEAVDVDTTRVRVSMTGFRDGAAFDELYAFFARGNAYTLQELRERVVNEPVNWKQRQ